MGDSGSIGYGGRGTGKEKEEDKESSHVLSSCYTLDVMLGSYM